MDFDVPDLAEGEARVVALGAIKAEVQPHPTTSSSSSIRRVIPSASCSRIDPAPPLAGWRACRSPLMRSSPNSAWPTGPSTTRAARDLRFREQGIVLPTFSQLADPGTLDPKLTAGVDKDAADPRNLFRVHWYNDWAATSSACRTTWCCRRS